MNDNFDHAEFFPHDDALRDDARFPWLAHYPECVPHRLRYPQFPAYGLLERTAVAFPDRIACHYYRQQVTYAELAADARRTARVLVEQGVRPGDRVGILMPNVPEYLSILNGIWMAGGVAVALSPLSCAEEATDMLRATGCRIVVALDMLVPLLARDPAFPERILMTTLQDRLPGWQRLGYAFARLRRIGWRQPKDEPLRLSLSDATDGRDSDAFEPIAPVDLDAPAYVLPTGGTTGAPKAVVLSHRNLVSNAWQLCHWAGCRMGSETLLAVVPFFHSYGLSTCGMTGVALGATLVLHHRFIPRVAARLIDRFRPSLFPAVPAMLVALNHLYRDRPPEKGCLQFCISGGAPLDQAVAEEFARHTGAAVVEGYGLSEASPVTHVGPLDGTARPGTIGLPLPDVEARIVDPLEGTSILPVGEVGELVVRGPQVMLGYWNMPEATAATIRDGWLHTGDLALRDEDGFFRIVDRKKDLIITSGFNVFPADVENVLRRCPGVGDVAVVGVPDEERGELVKACIVPAAGTKFDLAVFDAFCREHLSKHKRPRAVEILDGDLPRNFLGKVLRRRLRTAAPQEPLLSSLAPTVVVPAPQRESAAPPAANRPAEQVP